MTIGQHCTWDVYQADSQKLSFVPYIDQMLHAVVAELGLAKVDAAFKQFEPVGVTGFILLAESHISIHTWPEHGFAAVDVFSCQPFDMDIVTKQLGMWLGTTAIEAHFQARGKLPVPAIAAVR